MTIKSAFRHGGSIFIPVALGLDKSMYGIPQRSFGSGRTLQVPSLEFTKYVDWARFKRWPRPELGNRYALPVIEFWSWRTKAIEDC